MVFDENPNLVPLWKHTERRKYTVALYYTFEKGNGHFDAILDIAKFFRVRNYCIDCECSYDEAATHRMKCAARCPGCTNMGWQYPCVAQQGYQKLCPSCNRTFQSRTCFENHLKNQCCKMYKKCEVCNKPYAKREDHVCGEERCRTCHVYHKPDRSCFIEPLKIPKDIQPYRIVCFGIECRQDLIIENDVAKNVSNCVSARVACRCNICEPNRNKMWSEAEVEAPFVKFMDWLLNAWDHHHDTVVYAHYGGRYDHHFVLNRLCEMNLRPTIVQQGLKIYEMKLKLNKRSKLIFRDSYLLMPVKLAALPQAFGLDIEAKMYFPHLYNLVCFYY